MTPRIQNIMIAVVLATTFALGRYTAPTTPNVTQTVTDNKNEAEDLKKDTHEKTVIVKDAKTGNTITTITTDTTSELQDKKNETTKTDTTVTASARRTLNVSGLAGVSFSHLETPVYGISVSKEFIGPVTVGLFGMNNGILGVSVGLDF